MPYNVSVWAFREMSVHYSKIFTAIIIITHHTQNTQCRGSPKMDDGKTDERGPETG